MKRGLKSKFLQRKILIYEGNFPVGNSRPRGIPTPRGARNEIENFALHQADLTILQIVLYFHKRSLICLSVT